MLIDAREEGNRAYYYYRELHPVKPLTSDKAMHPSTSINA